MPLSGTSSAPTREIRESTVQPPHMLGNVDGASEFETRFSHQDPMHAYCSCEDASGHHCRRWASPETD